MYREEGREPESEIPHLILERNLYGIDIDARAVQIAALALYLKACSIAGPDFRPGQINLVAADAVLSGEEPPAEYMARFKGDPDALNLVKSIWQGLRNVREFGSLLHPERARGMPRSPRRRVRARTRCLSGAADTMSTAGFRLIGPDLEPRSTGRERRFGEASPAAPQSRARAPWARPKARPHCPDGYHYDFCPAGQMK